MGVSGRKEAEQAPSFASHLCPPRCNPLIQWAAHFSLLAELRKASSGMHCQGSPVSHHHLAVVVVGQAARTTTFLPILARSPPQKKPREQKVRLGGFSFLCPLGTDAYPEFSCEPKVAPVDGNRLFSLVLATVSFLLKLCCRR